jgi:adenine-specific DNA-methyltransferase
MNQSTLSLFESQTVPAVDGSRIEDPRFLKEQLVTYIGNKRSLLSPIQAAISQVAEALGQMPSALDAFAGSGVVSRLLKSQASHVVSNDLEPYARILGQCYLSNRDEVPWERLHAAIDSLNETVDRSPSTEGFIERLYAPADDDDIEPGERVFYTRDNARRLDHFSQLIRDQDADLFPYLLAPLLSAASVHANTAGVFKGFYKDRETGIGRFGGKGEDALSRIKGKIRLRPPVLSRYSGTYEVLQQDANSLPDLMGEIDLAYLDPPYNQHPYGSNYFMLNLLVDYEEPGDVSRVSGIPADWRRSGYNVKKQTEGLLTDLVSRIPARFLLISFNDEGFVSPESMLDMLEQIGSVEEFRTSYNAYRGSRNLHGRSIHVTEHLYLVDKQG